LGWGAKSKGLGDGSRPARSRGEAPVGGKAEEFYSNCGLIFM